jgi:hypothetical protein
MEWFMVFVGYLFHLDNSLVNSFDRSVLFGENKKNNSYKIALTPESEGQITDIFPAEMPN